MKDGTHGTHQDSDVGVYLLSAKNIKNGEIVIDKTADRKISEEEFEVIHSTFKLQKKDVLLTIVGSIGEVAILQTPDIMTFQRSVAFLRPKEWLIPSFLKTEIESDIFQKELSDRKSQSAQPGIYLGELEKIPFVFPVIEEQQVISSYFRNLDRLITLHQRKLDKLHKVKRSLLERMFPRNGANVPEIRFSGFTDAWEQRKLSEIADKVTEKNAGLQYVETFTNSAEFGIISQRDFFDHDIAKLGSLDGYYIVKSEDFVYNPRISTSAPVGPINRNKLGRTGVMSPLYTVFRPHDIDTTYLEYFFKCGCWHSFMNFNGDSGARSDRFSIKDNVFFQMPMPIPHIDEQRKIGELLTRLDHLITLHQRKCNYQKKSKKIEPRPILDSVLA